MEYEAPRNGFRTFLVLWATQSVSVLGSAITFFALSIWLTTGLYPHADQRPQLAFGLSLIGLAWALPSIFLAPLCGAWADRHDRKRTMIVADIVNGCLSLVLIVLMLTQSLTIWVLVLCAALFAGAGGFHHASFDASHAMLVPTEKLPRANGMMATSWSLAGMLAPGMGALIIALPALARQGILPGPFHVMGWLTDGVPLAIALDAASFFFSAAVLPFLTIPSPYRSDLAGDHRKSIWGDVREGAVYIWHRRPMLWLLGTFTVCNLLWGPDEVLWPLIVKFNLAPDWEARGYSLEAVMALIGTASSAGGLFAGLLISFWGGLKRRRVYGILFPLICSGVAMAVAGGSPWLWLTIAMGFLMSMQIPILNAHSQAIWQNQTPPELQGRVFSVRRVIAQGISPLSMGLAGWFGGRFNPGAVMATLGVIMAVLCLGQLLNPMLMRIEDREWLEKFAARAKDHVG